MTNRDIGVLSAQLVLNAAVLAWRQHERDTGNHSDERAAKLLNEVRRFADILERRMSEQK